MKTVKKIMMTVFLLFVATGPAFGFVDQMGIAGISLTMPVGTGAGGFSAGVDMNIDLTLFNAGVSARAWNKSVAGWDGEPIRSEATGYIGMGILSILQIQLGRSGSGSSLRIRSDIPLEYRSYGVGGLWARTEVEGILMISPFVEMSRSGPDRRIFGIGIGWRFPFI